MASDTQYPEFSGLNMPKIEQELLAKWKADGTFKKSIDNREGALPFVFYEGPPSANGMPGIHHVISRTLKDLVCRYKTMQGFQVPRKAGWDTHGLPVELGVEKELGITKEDIGKSISIEDYNKKCREAVMRYTGEWESITEKMGYWVDMSKPYITYETKYIETLWWCLKELFKKDLLYKSVSIQPYSPAAGTGLSSHELNQPGTYKDVKDTTVVAMFKVAAGDSIFAQLGIEGINTETYFLAWTTTPWTLPSNCGLTVGANIEYVLVDTLNPYTQKACSVILAKALLAKYFKADAAQESQAAFAAAIAGAEVAEIHHEGRGSTITRTSEDAPTAASGSTSAKRILPWYIRASFQGKVLEGIRYEQLLPFSANEATLSGGDPFRVILGDFVTTEDGTGIVHTAPAFGADDFRVGKKNNLGMFTLVDKEGKFVEGTDNPALDLYLSGRFVKNYRSDSDWKDTDLDIALFLKANGQAFRVEKYEHNYPHCWRTDKPIIYYPLDAWFIRTTAAKDRMVELNRTINWKPKSTGEGRFGNWLENMVDWNLSRSRYWGTPLPIWVSEDGAEMKCIGSVAELEEEIKQANKVLGTNQFIHPSVLGDGDKVRDSFSAQGSGIDLHKPWVDQIVLATKDCRPMHREPDLIDVWFDSGAMPYAQQHFPFENVDAIIPTPVPSYMPDSAFPGHLSLPIPGGAMMQAKAFPADFIAEGVDQTRGWFYTLHALSVLLFDSVAYKTVVSNGLVLDKNGQKMSKRVGNVIDPFKTIDQYSADASRWYLITNASPWDSLKFDIEGIAEVQRKFFGTIYNTYQFFALYANVDGFRFKEAYIPLADRPETDRWIISVLNTLVNDCTAAMDDFEPTQAGRAIEYFVDEQLSNWYVRLNRRRFWKGEYEQDKIAAYQTLYECLETLALLIAPISPFFADWLFANLNGKTQRIKTDSVHLADYPVANTTRVDADLEQRMKLAQDVSSLILSIRKKANIKVRQPLQRVMIPVANATQQAQFSLIENLIKNEVNVKQLEYLAESNSVIHKRVKPNFKLLGARLGGKMKAAAALIQNISQEQIAKLEQEGLLRLPFEENILEVQRNEVDIIAEDIPGWAVANKDTLTVALDLSLTPELEQEGLAREFINRIQKLRKDEGFELTDRICVKVEDNEALWLAITNHKAYICAEILAEDIISFDGTNSQYSIELNGVNLMVLILKIN